jgi:hypothetical protein
MNSFLESVRKNVLDIAVTLGVTVAAAALMAYMQMARYYSMRDIALFAAPCLTVPTAALGWYTYRRLGLRIPRVQQADSGPLNLSSGMDPRYVKGGEWLKILADNYNPRKRRLQVPIGFDNDGDPVELSMRGSESHLSIIGMTGTGKSVLVNQFLVAAAMTGNYQVVVVTRTKKDYTLIENMPNIHVIDYGSGFSAAESRQVYAKELPVIFNSVLEEMVRRQNYLQSKGVGSVYAKRLRPDERPHNMIVVFEEFINAVEMIGLLNGQQEKNRFLAQIQVGVQEFRAVGMKLVLVGQKASGAIPQGVLQQMTAVTLRVGSSQESFWATGRKKIGAESLRVIDDEDNPKVSSEILLTGTKSGTRRCNMALTSPDTIEKAVEMFRDEIRTYPDPTWLHDYRRVVASRPHIAPDIPTPHRLVATQDERPPVVSKMLSARVVKQAAELAYQKSEGFSEWRDGRKRSFTEDKAVMAFLMLHSGSSKTEVVERVFGGRNSDRFRFATDCEEHYDQLRAFWMRKYGVKA